MLRRLSRKSSSSSLDPKVVRAKFLEFIDSSIWALPIATFIEQRSVVFDRQQGDVLLFERIHKEFSELVDTLVECFCADTNIPMETLREALKSAEPDKLTIRQRTSLEPLAAAKDFNVFVPMMMRKNVELQLQALQMIEFMCGLLPSVLQIEDGETLKNKTKVISPEETERYVLIAVMRQSKEEFDNLTKSEMEELEDVLRSSEEERRRLEMQRGKEEELFSRALAARKEDERRLRKQEGSTTTSSRIETSTPLMQKNAEPGVTPEEGVPQIAERFQTSVSMAASDSKPTRAATAKKERQELGEERSPSRKSSSASQRERRPSVTEKTAPTMAGAPLPAPSERAPSPSGKPPPAPSEKTPPKSRGEGRPPTGKRLNTASGAGVETVTQKGAKERRPSTEARKRKELGRLITNTGKKDEQEQEDDGVTYGPRGKNIYDVNALLQQPNRLNSATVRSREEYLRMQRDRLLAMKANEREKQLNEVSQRAAQERPRTAKAARGLMRGTRGGIGSDDVLAARRAIVDQLKSEIDDSST